LKVPYKEESVTDRRDIIEMRGESGDEGEIFYASSGPPRPRKPREGFLTKVFGIALGVGIFLALIFFFVYVVLPVIAILIIWGLLQNIFRARR
jgi:hypothetical protein